MADSPQETIPGPAAPPAPTTQDSDETTAFLTKMLVGMILGPKLSPILAQLGITVDPTMLSVVIGGALHKLHKFLQAETGWTWL